MAILYISSYGNDDDKGIYIVKFNELSQTMELVKQLHTSDFPSYMITKNNILYVSYKNATKNNSGGGIASFSIEQDSLVLNNNYNSSGRSYTHLCVSNDQKYLFAANYHVGSTAAYELENKCISKKICAIHHQGCGPDLLKRQTVPHVHYVGFTPDNKYLYAVDLGADKVVLYKYENGQLVEDDKHTLNVVPGSGPRHMIFSQDGKYAYLVNEIANNLMVFKYTNEMFCLIQVINTVPKHFDGLTSASAIRLSNSGNHLFISNRGHDSIALYRVNKDTGKVSLLYMVHTGKNPRDFNLLDDKYLFVGAQDDNLLQLLIFNEEKEELILTDSSLSLPAPVCITFNQKTEKK